MGGKASYVFKTTAVSMKIAAMMAGNIKVGREYSSLRREPAFFNGMLKCVKYFVSLTLWVFHPAMWMMVMLAVMDMPHEHSDDRVGVPSLGHFLHVLTVFPVVIQINCHSL